MSASPSSDSLQDKELLLEFAAESLEHMSTVEPLLLAMEESEKATGEDLNEIFRALHSIKGGAGFLGLEEIQRLSHASETLLMKLRDGELSFQRGMSDALLQVVDHLRTMLESLPEDDGECPEQLVRDIRALADGGEAPEDESREEPRPTYTAPDDLRFGAIGVSIGLLTDAQVGQILDVQKAESEKRSFGSIGVSEGLLTPDQVELIRSEQRTRMAVIELEQAQAAERTDTAGKRDEKRTSEKRPETIRVYVSLLDELMNMAGELVLGRNQLMQVMGGTENQSTRRVLQGLDLVTTRLQEHIMHTRMQPMRVLFDRIPRQVRDIASKLDKQVELHLVGKEVELDRSILEALGDPLTHLVRNAIDHGIESPEERTAAGKPAKGALTVRAHHEGGQIIVEIEDDGKGIDPAKLKKAAAEKGILSEEKLAAMSDAEAAKLIFQPGLSTAEEVTTVSGRGVGMDVVLSNIQALSGQIDLRTKVGEGTTIRIQLPLTLAIIPSLTVSIGTERFAIPQVNLAEVVRLRNDEVEERCARIRGVEVLRIRDQLLPLVRLGKSLNIDPPETAKPDKRLNIVVLKAGARRYGLVVDELHDNEEIVVKPLSQYVKGCSWYAGATILGDGKVVMILDAMGVLRRCGVRLEEIEEELQQENEVAKKKGKPTRSMLLFRNGEEECFAVDIRQLRRLERVESSVIERVGSREFLQHRGTSIPLVRLEDHLPVSRAAADVDKLFVLIPRTADPTVGIIATSIVDALETSVEPSEVSIKGPGLLGAGILSDRMTLFIDPEELVGAATQGGTR
ncbi:MAG TPA: chemotaxis protein CheA [Planctomycetes bacterium]|nr:chemotaxis protein CheA [Planctomycetota bacterium]